MMSRMATKLKLIRPSIVSPGPGRHTSSPAAVARFFSDNISITYSGGQASEGQGGYYGSGGARVITKNEEHRPEMLALQADVQKVIGTMQELEVLEHSLEKEDEMISSRAIEIRQSIKKLMTSPDFLGCLNRLEVQGSPVWGLSSEERELIIHARDKVNEC